MQALDHKIPYRMTTLIALNKGASLPPRTVGISTPIRKTSDELAARIARWAFL